MGDPTRDDPTPDDPIPSGADGDGMEGMLARAFRRSQSESVLAAISRIHGDTASVALQPTDAEAPPVQLARDDGAEEDSRYHVYGEIARGGIGVIYHGRDKSLNRDVALKVIRREYAEREDVLQRFVEEAQVGGQLQHPGIVPVYGIGIQADGRPSFAMKLIKGQTLAELLRGNPRGIDLITVFEQICQAIAYAHSRGVIHRDLKPANVMIGSFGEVYVVDWGFAKVLGQEEVARAPERTVIATVRSGPIGSQSIAGSVMGTPAYMPPEQALGQIEDLDKGADVFALGAVLCEILSGQAPYTGKPKDQLVAAAQCDLEKCFERLDAAPAREEFKQLVRDCLARQSGERPHDASVVVERLTTTLAEADARAKAAELETAHAEAEAARALAARKRTRALAAVAALLVVIGGGSFLWWRAETDAREGAARPQVQAALREAAEHEGAQDFEAAAAAAKRAVDLSRSAGLEADPAETVHARLIAARDEAAEAARIAAEDDALLAALQAIYSEATHARPGRVRAWDRRRREAVESHFGDLDAAAARMRSSAHAAAFAAHLGAWCRELRTHVEGSDWERLDVLAREVDPHHAELHTALLGDDAPAVLERADAHAETLPAPLAADVGRYLRTRRLCPQALRFLETQVARHPTDYRLHVSLLDVARIEDQRDLCLRHALAAAALRPRSASCWALVARAHRKIGHVGPAREALERAGAVGARTAEDWAQLGMTHVVLGDQPEAERCYRKAIELEPTAPAFHAGLAQAIANQGRHEEALDSAQQGVAVGSASEEGAQVILSRVQMAQGDLDGAIGTLRGYLDRDPTSARVHVKLIELLDTADRDEEAEAVTNRVLEIQPPQDGPLTEVALRLLKNGAHERAELVAREIATRSPRRAGAWAVLVIVLDADGRIEAAVEAARMAAAAVPNTHNLATLARLLYTQGAYDEALPLARRALARSGRTVYAQTATLLTGVLAAKGDLEGALEVADRLIERLPEDPRHYSNRMYLLRRLGRHDEAAAQFEQAAAAAPASVSAYIALARWLQEGGPEQDAEGLRWVERAVAEFPEDAVAHGARARALCEVQRWDDAEASARRALALDANQVDAVTALGMVAVGRSRHEQALVHFRRAEELTPGDGPLQWHIGRTLLQRGDVKGARVALERAQRMGATSVQVNFTLAAAYRRLGLPTEEIAQYEQAFELNLRVGEDRNQSVVARLLGNLLMRQKRLTEARDVVQKALAIEPDNLPLLVLSISVYQEAADNLGALETARRLTELQPQSPGAWWILGNVLSRHMDDHEGAAAAYETALRLPGPPVVRARVQLALAGVQANQARFEESEATAKAAAALLASDASSLGVAERQAVAEARALVAAFLSEGLPGMQREATRAQAYAAGELEPESVADAAVIAKTLFFRHRDYPAARRAMRQALAWEDAIGGMPHEGYLLLGVVLSVRAGPAHFEEGLGLARRHLKRRGLDGHASPESILGGLRHLQTTPHMKAVRDVSPLPPGWKAYWDDLARLEARYEEEARR